MTTVTLKRVPGGLEFVCAEESAPYTEPNIEAFINILLSMMFRDMDKITDYRKRDRHKA